MNERCREKWSRWGVPALDPELLLLHVNSGKNNRNHCLLGMSPNSRSRICYSPYIIQLIQLAKVLPLAAAALARYRVPLVAHFTLTPSLGDIEQHSRTHLTTRSSPLSTCQHRNWWIEIPSLYFRWHDDAISRVYCLFAGPLRHTVDNVIGSSRLLDFNTISAAVAGQQQITGRNTSPCYPRQCFDAYLRCTLVSSFSPAQHALLRLLYM
jgi:hypothetical protein